MYMRLLLEFNIEQLYITWIREEKKLLYCWRVRVTEGFFFTFYTAPGHRDSDSFIEATHNLQLPLWGPVSVVEYLVEYLPALM